MRQAMQGSDVVFHVAGYADIGEPDSERMETVNVGGTRKVLRLAHELHIPRLVFTSSVGVFGDTKGQLVDETYQVSGPFLTEHARTKWLAHYKVVQPMLEKGAPIIIVMPGAVYGPGGRGLITDMMRIFYRRYPVVAGADTVLTFAHVEDIAEGHVLAAEKGHVGETYILTGPAVSLADMLDFWTYLTGVKAPQIRLPAGFVRAFPLLMTLLGSLTGLKAAFSREAAQVAGKTFIARSEKARNELGWQTRPLQGGMLKTLDWIAETETDRRQQVRRREQQLGGLALLTAGLLTAAWLYSRRRQSD
jgi:dihydroflavonol-4-reductase